MLVGHVFENFKKDFEGESVLTAEKNTKKELNRILEKIQQDTRKNIIYIVQVSKFSIDKLYELAIQSHHMLKNIAEHDFSILFIEHELLSQLEERKMKPNLLKSIYNANYQQMKEIIQSLNEKELLQFIFHLNEKANEVKKSLLEQKSYYEEQLFKASAKVEKDNWYSMLENLKNPYQFQVIQTNLFSLYEDCFNLARRIANPYLSVNPSPKFQRHLVWTLEKKMDFIDSIINDIPIGAFYVNSSIDNLKLGEGCGNLLWDGKQRIFTVHEFIQNSFPVIIEGQPVYYSEAPTFFNRLFSRTRISVYKSYFTKMEDIVEAYIKINKKQIKHTDEDLQQALSVLEK